MIVGTLPQWPGAGFQVARHDLIPSERHRTYQCSQMMVLEDEGQHGKQGTATAEPDLREQVALCRSID